VDLTHFNEDGLPRMVDVSEKELLKELLWLIVGFI